MENFVVSARKYRPATFDTVVGQHHITSTLKNAIRNNHLAQAFLFCGPRGVGKTTCARILAKTINCFKLNEHTEACNECESCVSFNNGQSLNIQELDAASNNSVDDIRSLVDQVRFLPSIGKFKIYIIDEVHMLSSSAFNAFLKTLEEPPAHAIFILATTEKHKILPTILSRCQIFDFHRITIRDIAGQLDHIAGKENVNREPAALAIIAQKADGAMRDALSMFDQLVNFTGNNLSYNAVIQNLNILDQDYYFKVTDAITTGDFRTALLIFNDVIENGFDGHNFISGLGSHFRDLLISRDNATLKLLETADDLIPKYKAQAASCSVNFLMQALTMVSKTELSYKASKNARLLVELSLIQMANIGAPLVQQMVNANQAQTATVQKSQPAQASAPVTPQAPLPVAPPQAIVNPPVPSSSDQSNYSDNRPKPQLPPTGFGTISIKSGIEKKKPEPELVKEADEPVITGEFTESQLIQAWHKYAIKVQVNRPDLFATLTSRKPSLKESYRIEYVLDTTVQENEFKIEKLELLRFLKEELGNTLITIEPIVAAMDPNTHRVFTSHDKFRRMAEKNPALLKLRQQLDLDVS